MSGAITAVVATVAAATTAEVFTAVAVAGAVLGAVGTVTGIKPLQYAGLALGAVGGIGALAVSAGVIGGDALTTAAGGLASDGGFAGAVGSDVAAGGGVAASATDQALIDAGLQAGTQSAGISSSVATGANTASGDIVNAINGQVTTPDASLTAAPANAQSPTVQPSAATDTGATGVDGQPIAQGDGTGGTLGTQGNPAEKPGLVDQGASSPLPVGTAAPPAPAAAAPSAPATGANPVTQAAWSTTPDPNAGIAGSADAAAQAAAKYGAVVVNPTTAASAAQLADGGTGAFSKIIDILGKPGIGTLTAGAIQAAGSFIAGATSSLTPAQVNALKAQANMNQAAANLSTQQLSNIQSGIPTAARTPPAGIVNATAQRPAVTGAPA